MQQRDCLDCHTLLSPKNRKGLCKTCQDDHYALELFERMMLPKEGHSEEQESASEWVYRQTE